MDQPRLLIGWNEYVDIPDWGIRRLRAKVDTGARSSALHVENIVELPHRHVRFDVVLHRAKRDRRVHVTAPIARFGRVRSSTGRYEMRIFVEASVMLGPVERRIEVSLVDRGKMIFRMLLGRTALAGHFVIDPGRRHILHPKRATRKLKKGAARTKKKARRPLD